jgi:hypothetical protein
MTSDAASDPVVLVRSWKPRSCIPNSPAKAYPCKEACSSKNHRNLPVEDDSELTDQG